MATETAADAGFARMIRALAHDLRTPLNAILGYSEMLGEDLDIQGLQEPASDVRRIHEAARTLLGQIDALATLARVTGEGVRASSEPIDWVTLCGDAARQLRSAKGVAIPVEIRAVAGVRPSAVLEAGDAHLLAEAFLRAVAEWGDGEPLTVTVGPLGETGIELETDVAAAGVTGEELEGLLGPEGIGKSGRRGLYFKTVLAVCRGAHGDCEVRRNGDGRLVLRASVGAS